MSAWPCGLEPETGQSSVIEKRNITKEDIHLEARLLSEGVRIEIRTPPERPPAFFGTIVMDGCEITTFLRPDRYSRMQAG